MANHQVASRRKCEEIIVAGRVKVNGVVVKELGTKVSQKDEILVDDQPISKQPNTYILMNKPAGTISSANDEKNRKTVLDLLSPEDQKARVYPVGRLDYDTSGLIILTNDGDLTLKLTHPKFHVDKTYMAVVEGIITKQAVKTLRDGVRLPGYTAKAAFVRVHERRSDTKESLVELVLTQGKNHQVKDMFSAVGFPVLKLTRTKLAFLTLDGVTRGGYRYLKIHEVKKLYGFQK
jgi:23S rRNA pseudouridine2605 synthase